jgi:hypothetical protein
MKRLFKITNLALLMFVLSAIVLTEAGCSSPKKGYNYSAHNKRNNAAHRYQNKRFKKAGGDQLNFSCPRFKKK